MKRGRGFWDRFAQQASNINNTIPDNTILEIVADRRVLLENHLGVTQYSEEKVCVKVHFGNVIVLGCGMHLQHMTKERLVISGKIEGVTLHRRGNK